MPENNANVLLRVEHLEQYFKNGRYEVKAVDDISFEIQKGEVLGLVGESGCGKTTTGRSIIRLYDITSGNIYFKGQRIAAGTRKDREEIAQARESYRSRASRARAEYRRKTEGASEEQKKVLKAELDAQLASLAEETAQVCSACNERIRSAVYDRKNCNREYISKLVADTDALYQPKLAALQAEADALGGGGGEKYEQAVATLNEAKAEYARQIAFDKKARIMQKMQMIFQDPIASLNPRMTVREIIAEGLVIRGFRDKKEINDRVYRVLELVGLVPEHATRYPHEFSGGQRQRIGIARAIVLEPELIIADEPVSALDVSIQAQVINLLNDLRARLGLTILFIAHDLSVVKYFSDRIAVMYFGKIVELAPSEELFKNPMHPYTRSLLSAIPLPDPLAEKARKRILYNPLAEHDYSVQKPSMRELLPGHFVYCNDAELETYRNKVAP